MTRFCETPGCSRKHAAKGLCGMHYDRQRDRNRSEAVIVKPGYCHHFRCPHKAAYRITWPHPIGRKELACAAHTQQTQIALIPSVQIERIESK